MITTWCHKIWQNTYIGASAPKTHFSNEIALFLFRRIWNHMDICNYIDIISKSDEHRIHIFGRNVTFFINRFMITTWCHKIWQNTYISALAPNTHFTNEISIFSFIAYMLPSWLQGCKSDMHVHRIHIFSQNVIKFEDNAIKKTFTDNGLLGAKYTFFQWKINISMRL